MDESWEASVHAVAALDEPTRRRLYEFVAAQPRPVTRDDAVRALGVPRTTAAFHLDRLADEGLLAVEFERRTGRTGPGAGRPAKLYRRSDRQFTVYLPERQYDLAGKLLAAAVERAEDTGEPPRQAVYRTAHQYGRDLVPGSGELELVGLLTGHGFEPRAETGGIVLGNCPFQAIARDHGQLVCGMTFSLLTGLIEALGDSRYAPTPDPGPGRCCVRLAARPAGRTQEAGY